MTANPNNHASLPQPDPRLPGTPTTTQTRCSSGGLRSAFTSRRASPDPLAGCRAACSSAGLLPSVTRGGASHRGLDSQVSESAMLEPDSSLERDDDW